MRKYLKSAMVFLCSLILAGSVTLASAQQAIPSFPGAEGFGATNVGGRGGDVYVVSTLNDSGPGSLRECVEASGPRTCVFSVGGTIVLQDQYRIENPFLTIAGQTAPGGGITIRNDPNNTRMAFRVQTNDVIVRFLTIRPGASIQSSSSLRAFSTWHREGLAHDVIADHISASWAPDEIVSTWYTANNITYQWMMVYEGLNCSTHSDGCPHSKGPLFGSDGAHSISFHHSLMAHNGDRNPVVKIEGVIDLVNLIVYNPEFSPSKIEADFGPALGNFVGNWYKPGINSGDDYNLKIQNDGGGGASVYVQGNIGPLRPNNTLPEDLVVVSEFNTWQRATPHPAPPVTTYSCNSVNDCEMFNRVTQDAGNSRGLTCEGDWYYRRDAHDTRIVNDVINGTGQIIDDPVEVGGWLNISNGPSCVDNDQDGMPAVWEEANGLDDNNPDDRNLLDPSGYTMLEMYINGSEVVSPPPPPEPEPIPTDPSNVTASSLSNTEIQVNWNDTSDNEDGFNVEKSVDGGATWNLLVQLGENATTTSDSGLSPGEYCYRVQSFNETGASGFVNSNCVTLEEPPPPEPEPPLAPDTLTAVSEPDSFVVHTMWNDNSDDETGFELQRRLQSVALWNILALLPANTISYDDTTVSLDTYCYRVRSVNDVGASVFTPEACVEVTETPEPPQPPDVPAAPTNLVATILNNGKLMLTWVDNSDNETGFVVEEQNDDGTWTVIRVLPDNKEVYRPNRLDSGMQYCYRVLAVNDVGLSEPTNVACNVPLR